MEANMPPVIEISTPADLKKKIGLKAVVRFAAFVLLVPALFFLSAGRLNWWQGWVLVSLFLLATFLSRIIALLKNPGLIAERANYNEKADTKPWDKILLPIVAYSSPITWIIGGLDVRFHWSSQLPLALQLVALALIILGFALSTWAMVANQFFGVVVRIQKERGHRVVNTGPYRFIRHPGYAGGVLAGLATPLFISSLWAFIPVGLLCIASIVRTALEDHTLQEELPGYAEYAHITRYRLMPGIW